MAHGSENPPPLMPPDDEDRPNPPRFCWLKRSAWLAVALLVAIVLLQVMWSQAAKRRTSRFIAEAHARGEPIFLKDFAPASVPDADNAANPLNKAEDLFRNANYRQNEELSALVDASDGFTLITLPLSREDDHQITDWLTAHGEILQLVRVARSQKELDGEYRFARPGAAQGQRYKNIDLYHRLADMVILSALHEHTSGNDAEAIERLRDARFLGVAIGRGPTAAEYFYRQMIEFLTVRAIRALTADLSIDGSGSMQNGTVAARREQIAALINELLNESSLRKSLQQVYYSDRMLALTSTADQLQRNLGGGILYAAHPLFELEAIRTAQSYSDCVAAAGATSWPAAIPLLPKPDDKSERSPMSDMLLSGIRSPSGSYHGLSLIHYYCLLGERRVTATMLALRLWSLDHDGKLPSSLAELVPAYLPKVPADPFRADGGPISYLSRGIRPALYSVGSNMVDDGGSEIRSPDTRFHPWDARDAVFPLRPDPVPASPKADDNNTDADKNAR